MKDDVSPDAGNLKTQYLRFNGKAPKDLLLFQIGGYYEFFDKTAQRVIPLTQLAPIPPRRGFAVRCGFPKGMKEDYLKKLLPQGLPIWVVDEVGPGTGGIKHRQIVEAWLSTTDS